MKQNNLNSFGFDCLLFERCNLHCTFCLEEHSVNDIDIQWIRQLPSLLLERFEKEYEKHSETNLITFRIWGGELFFDALPNELFEEYKMFVEQTKRLFNKTFPGIKLDFAWVSNGVFKNIERVINLLKETNSGINLSYDPIGRFHKKELEDLMIESALHFHSLGLLNEISITLTKPCINAYINDKSRLLDLKFAKKIDINYYIPNINWKTLLPSDDDLFNFFKWAINNKLFQIIDLNSLLLTLTGKMSKCVKGCNCHKHLSACKNCITYNCVKSSTIFPNADFYGDTVITEDNVSEIKKYKGMCKRGCFYCKYIDKCPGCCWTSIIYKNATLDDCPFKKIIEYVEQNSNIKNEFMQWKL